MTGTRAAAARPARRLLECGLIAAMVAGGAGAAAAGPESPRRGDVREFTVGLTIDELPATGYLGFACGHNGGKPDPKIAGWRDYATCPADERGLHEVAFQYDDSEVLFDDLEGTAIAGHPVLISLLINDDGVVDGLRVLSDPFTRPYNKRRGRVLSLKVKARFGMDGWDCEQLAAEAGETEVGGVFTKERCRKDLGDRTIDLYTRFYRVLGASGVDLVSETKFEIWRKAGDAKS